MLHQLYAPSAYGAEPKARLIGLGGVNFALGSGLSSEAEQAIAEAIEEVTRLASSR